MKRTIITTVVIAAIVLGGLYWSMKINAPKPPPPTRSDIWSKDGVPVETGEVTVGNMETSVPVTGSIDALDQGVLSPKISGRISAVNFRAGDAISAGQVFAVIDQTDAINQLNQAKSALQQALSARETAAANLSKAVTGAKVTTIQTDAAIAQAEANLSSAKAQLELVKQPARNQDRLIAENAVATAKAQMENAETEYKRAEKLYREGAVSQSVYDSARTGYVTAKHGYDSAMQQLSVVKEGGRAESVQSAKNAVRAAEETLRQAKANAAENLLRQEDIKSAKAGVKSANSAISNAKTSIAIAEQYLANTYIRAQVSGRLASRSVEPGQVVAPGQELGRLVNMGSLYFQAELSETDVVGVVKGQVVNVSVDALKGREITGRVDMILPQASLDNRKFPVRIRVAGSEADIMPGMYVRGSIVTGSVSGVIMVPKDAVDERRGSKLVFVIGKDNVAKRVDVQVVRDDGVMSQVKEPTTLKPGDKVATTGKQSLQDGDKVKVTK